MPLAAPPPVDVLTPLSAIPIRLAGAARRLAPSPLAAGPTAGEAAATQSFRVLAGGAALAALALAAGADHFAIGGLAAISALARVVHLGIPWLLARWGAGALLARAAWCERLGAAAAATVGLALPPHAIAWLLTAVAVASVGQQLYDGAMTATISERVPRVEHGRYAALRTHWASLAGVTVGLGGGLLVTLREAAGTAPALARALPIALGVAVSLGALWALHRLRALPALSLGTPARTRRPLTTTGAVPAVVPRRWRLTADERAIVAFGAAWGVAFGLTSRHTDACAVTVLGFPIGATVWLNGLWVGTAVFGAATWGRLADRFGGKAVLRLAILMLALDPAWSLLGVLVHPAFLVAGYAVYGIANAGYGIALAPSLMARRGTVGDRVRPVAIFQAAFGLAAGAGPLLGGALLEAGAGLGAAGSYALLFAIALVARLLAVRLVLGLPAPASATPRHLSRVLWRAARMDVERRAPRHVTPAAA